MVHRRALAAAAEARSTAYSVVGTTSNEPKPPVSSDPISMVHRLSDERVGLHVLLLKPSTPLRG